MSGDAQPPSTDGGPPAPPPEKVALLPPVRPDLYWIPPEMYDDAISNAALEFDSDEWRSQELHLFIITDAGKPVYARYGSLQRLTPFLCPAVGVISHLEAANEQLDHIRAGEHTFLFFRRIPLIFIVVSRAGLPVSYLFKQVNCLYCVFLMIFSQAWINEISRRTSCDFRQFAQGTRPAWDGVIGNICEDPAFVFAPSIPVSHLDRNLRDDLSRQLSQFPNYTLAMVMHRNRVLAVSNHGCDALSLRLLVDLVWTPPFRNTECWTPVFLHSSPSTIHQLYHYPLADFELLVLTPDHSAPKIYHAQGFEMMKSINTIGQRRPPAGAPDVFYCWAVHSVEHGQVYITDPSEEAFRGSDRKGVIRNMRALCELLAKTCDMVETNEIDGEYMFRGADDVIAVWKSRELEIYAVARTAALPDEDISVKLGELKTFVRQHFCEIIITATHFQIERFA
jgi:hypothetical protein